MDYNETVYNTVYPILKRAGFSDNDIWQWINAGWDPVDNALEAWVEAAEYELARREKVA